MGNIVRGTTVTSETWPLLDVAALRAATQATAADAALLAGVLVPLQLWREARDACNAISALTKLGIVLENTDDPAELAPDLERIDLIAIEFPRFTDGRGYSIARLLRGRYGYRGELRAIGDILRDQIFYLTRVGFDAFTLRDDQNPEIALPAGADFSVAYQASTDQPLPLFRRRAA